MDFVNRGCFLMVLSLHMAECQYSLTIFPQIYSQNGRTNFEKDRWNGHNGLDHEQFISGNKLIGSRTGRWLNADLGGVFQNAPEDPSRLGYADPRYFQSERLQFQLADHYLQNLKGYGQNLTLVMETKSQFWPAWMDTSLHGGVFPNNLDAGADMILMMVQAVYNYTGGVIPPYFEVINEPETLYQTVSWKTIIEYHQIVARKLHGTFPDIKVCGPTNDGDMEYSDVDDFKFWLTVRTFMDMSLYNLDIFTFHPYNSFFSQDGKHNFTGANEDRFVAFLDLIEAYAARETGREVPVIVSEYGLGPLIVDSTTTKGMIQWAYIFLHNSHMFTYLQHRGIMEKAVAFLLSDNTLRFVNASIFYPNGTETPVANAYRFWNNFNDAHRFLRFDNDFNGKQRVVSPLVMVDPETNNVTVLFHSYAQNHVNVTLNLDPVFAQPSSAVATCLYRDSFGNPIYSINQTVQITHKPVTLRPESSCFFTFHTDYVFKQAPVYNEDIYYAEEVVVKIVNNSFTSKIYVPSVLNVVSVELRIGVSIANKAVSTIPTRIQLNFGTCGTSDFFSHYGQDEPKTLTQWNAYTYNVPPSLLLTGYNAITLRFSNSGGYVSSVALIVGRINGNDNE